METLIKHSTANNSVLKILATVLFIVLPFFGFFLGMNYQGSMIEVSEPPTTLVRKPTPTPKRRIDETANWKTYTNEKYSFEFKYPLNLQLEEYSNSIILKREFISDPKNYDKNFWLNVSFGNNEGGKKLDSYFTSKFCETIKESAYTINLEKAIQDCKDRFLQTKQTLEVDGKPAIRAKNIYYVTERLITIINNDPNLIIFGLGESGEEGAGISEMAENTLNQILSTFKFLDQTPTP